MVGKLNVFLQLYTSFNRWDSKTNQSNEIILRFRDYTCPKSQNFIKPNSDSCYLGYNTDVHYRKFTKQYLFYMEMNNTLSKTPSIKPLITDNFAAGKATAQNFCCTALCLLPYLLEWPSISSIKNYFHLPKFEHYFDAYFIMKILLVPLLTKYFLANHGLSLWHDVEWNSWNLILKNTFFIYQYIHTLIMGFQRKLRHSLRKPIPVYRHGQSISDSHCTMRFQIRVPMTAL